MLVEEVAACCVSLFGLVVFGVLVHNSTIMFTKQIRIYPISWARIHRLLWSKHQISGHNLANQPALFPGMVFVTPSCNIWSIGFGVLMD
jgi:hypothetical protein